MRELSKTQWRLIWGIRVLLATAFGAAAIAKFLGAPMVVANFEQIGIGQWFRIFTGAVELLGVVLLLVPSGGFWAGLLLSATMACAVATHLFLIGGSAVPASILGALSAFVAWRLRPPFMRTVHA